MARYRRRSVVPAPLSDVWSFHSGIEGLLAVTPAWMRLRVESIRGPDGDDAQDVLTVGTDVRLSMRPFGLGPRLEWTSRIVQRERQGDVAQFKDEMIDGPFPRWIHTHRFEAGEGTTTITDLVDYELPLIPGPLSPVGWPFFEPLFAYRHRQTRRLFEDGGPRLVAGDQA